LWSPEEVDIFTSQPTSIHVLELFVVVVVVVVVVVAIFENTSIFCNSAVLVFVDNTSAVSWVNTLRSSYPEAQPWIYLLVLIWVSLNIHICATHIPGEENLIADGLSRNSQEWFVASMTVECFFGMTGSECT
jgi:hypothetical protein